MPARLNLACALTLVALYSGCATHADRLRAIRLTFYDGELAQASNQLHALLDNSKGKFDTDVLQLDLAMTELVAGRPEQAEQLLRGVRDRFDYFEQYSLGEAVMASLSDEQRKAYPGEDYEKILIRCMLALSNLMAGGEDAAAYGLQVAGKQLQIIQTTARLPGPGTELTYKRVALGAYINGLLREASHSDYDGAARSFEQVVQWAPDFEPGAAACERVRSGRHSAPGNGVVHVFALIGKGPYKEQVFELPTSTALLIADRILSELGPYSLPPTVAPIKVPKVVRSANNLDSVLVSLAGSPVGQTSTITDVTELAIEQYQAIYPQVIARAVVRRVVKKGAVVAGKSAIGKSNSPAVNLLLDLGGVAWEATEAADTRCWGLLPDKIQVLRLELPAGDHQIALQPAMQSRPIGPAESSTVRVEDGRDTYVLACFPSQHLVGEILTNQLP